MSEKIQTNEQNHILEGRIKFLPEHQGRTVTRIDTNRGNARTYDIAGVGEYRSVTSSVGILNKPAIPAWATKIAVLNLRGTLESRDSLEALGKEADKKNAAFEKKGKDTRVSWMDLAAKQASSAPGKVTKAARDFGEHSHTLVEKIVTDEPYSTEEWADYAHIAEGFKMWARDAGMTLVASELMVWHPEYEYGGTIDLVGRLNDGSLAVIDVKTGGVYNEAAYQLAAYATALEYLTGEWVTEAWALQLPRERDEANPDNYYNAMQLDSIVYWFSQFELMHKLAPSIQHSAFTSSENSEEA